MKKTRWLLYRCVLLVFVIELVSWREAFPQPAGSATLIEGAKKEGKVTWYATLNINDSNALLSRFEQKYPFIKTELLRAGTRTTSQPHYNRGERGPQRVGPGQSHYHQRSKKTRSLAGPPLAGIFGLPAAFKDPEGYWATVYNIYYVMGYNPKMVSPKDAPKNWDDFLDPKWKGKIGMDQEEYEWYAATMQLLGEGKGAKIP